MVTTMGMANTESMANMAIMVTTVIMAAMGNMEITVLMAVTAAMPTATMVRKMMIP